MIYVRYYVRPRDTKGEGDNKETGISTGYQRDCGVHEETNDEKKGVVDFCQTEPNSMIYSSVE